MAARGTKPYRQEQRQGARSLGMSVGSQRRLVKAWQELGVAGLSRQVRSDQGIIKASQAWQDFIVKTYKDGNRGSRHMSAVQVVVQVQARAQTLGVKDYPGRTTVYRMLRPHIENVQQKRALGWRQDRLTLPTREGLAIAIEWSNQVWQVDHTRADVLVVDQFGELLGRPWLTIVVDTYSRCMMGIHLGFDAPSSAVVCLALRHAILPKHYSSAYDLQGDWGTYGLPQYLYTDGGKAFRWQHLEQVATELGIVVCLRRKPSDGGIVERPFGTFNRQFFSTLPGYVSSHVETRSLVAESEACLTLLQLEQLLVRYFVDHYNPTIDARMGDQSRIGRWEAGRIAQLPLLGERELDVCLMRRDRRIVYRSGYLQFANLTYQGEHLAAYAGESVVLRYDPRDITPIFIYEVKESKEVFLTRAHAQGWETETLSYAEAQALSHRKREAGKAISNRSMLEEVRDRDRQVKQVQRQQRQKPDAVPVSPPILPPAPMTPSDTSPIAPPTPPPEVEEEKPKKPVPYVRG
ncbi:MAG: transposase family protein [Elainellaceae cyanobacterium]